MNNTIKKLPKSVQSLISASNQINSYTKSIQELVFNSLDADATSIAVRIHINEGSIQVVDNGSGISKQDLKQIGQNYMTSKVVDDYTLKSAPNKYGFQGQSLAHLIKISEILKITSHFNKKETTYKKTFKNGKAQLIKKCNPRPSKGTTVDIKGLLYNLSIQKKSVNIINELQNIKTFLEHISLLHPKISISLRDDAKNEIVFNVHKNRDIYQTLSTLYDIDKEDLQELQVEKNHYKVKAYIGKQYVELSKRSIFLNGKLIPESNQLYKKLDNVFKKQFKRTRKKNSNNDEENFIYDNKVPFYILFITCPYIDYELTSVILEFKNWSQINTLLDKLVKFHFGDVILRRVSPKILTTTLKRNRTTIDKSRIEHIMQTILGNHNKKTNISYVQNGIKGKLIRRRKNDKKITKSDCSNELMNRRNISASISEFGSSNQKNIQKASNGSRSKQKSKKIYSSTRITKSRTSKTDLILNQNNKTNDTPVQCAEINVQKQITTNNHIKTNKGVKTLNKQVSLSSTFAKGMESAQRRSEIVDNKSRRLLEQKNFNHQALINENEYHSKNGFIEDNKHITINQRVKEIIIHEYIPLPLKFNNENSERQKKSMFKSNYDLLHTVINSPSANIAQHEQILHENCKSVNEQQRSKPLNMYQDTINFKEIHQKKFNTYDFLKTPEHNFRAFLRNNNISTSTTIIERPYAWNFKNITPFSEIGFDNPKKERDKGLESQDDLQKFNIISPDKSTKIFPLPSESLDSHIRPYLEELKECSPFPLFTFQSHNYFVESSNHENDRIDYKKPRKFITTQSKENFMVKTNMVKTNNHLNNIRRKNNKKTSTTKILDRYHLKDTRNNNTKSIRDSFTIDCTESNDDKYRDNLNINNQSKILNEYDLNNKSVEQANTYSLQKNDYNEKINYIENTIPKIYSKPDTLSPSKNNEFCETYTIENLQVNNCAINSHEKAGDSFHENQNDKSNFVFLSQSQENNDDVIDPLNICETILNVSNVTLNQSKELNLSFHTDKTIVSNNGVTDEQKENSHNICNDSISFDPLNFDLVETTEHAEIKFKYLENNEEVSHHFSIPDSVLSEFQRSLIFSSKVDIEIPNELPKAVETIHLTPEHVQNNFYLKNRLGFVPKGLSPLFKHRQMTRICEYNLNEEYYEDDIYNTFLDKVQNDADIFKPRIREGNKFTNHICKVNDKLKKNNAALKFDSNSLQNTRVLGQVDKKFIAATITDKTNEFFVLFDQHAVHERIRLEANLADYVDENHWKSVSIDEITLKITRDSIIYLHNYRDKFKQFGLDWKILNNIEILLIAIPEGILGKNPRSVDKIIKAVKNLIAEEINNIQMQRGCTSLYPKSIMDLVFSEACRYSVKFGDILSKTQCIEMLKKLSNCKTPFQCAHGRPSMAVIMNIERSTAVYKINFSKLENFVRK